MDLRTRASRRQEFRYNRRRRMKPTYTHLIDDVEFICSARDLETTIGQLRRLLRASDRSDVVVRP
ncbi:hypothetical protein [Actinokineospora inagensis]|uniref:hypothetical protein n=1 Tax=Actinokineospora inagensis TaxID=103730 RepID=UPI0012FA4E8B|nr:hypothetical protein [Actinokineospora inagensis]